MVIPNSDTAGIVRVSLPQHNQSDSSSNETTPLNRHSLRALNDNHSDTSSGGVTSVPSSVKYSPKMDNTRKILFKIAIDFLLLFIVGFSILIFFLWGTPYKRGFFCNDESLMHPFHESTVRNWMLYLIGLLGPLIIIITVETTRAKLNKDEESPPIVVFNRYVPPLVQTLYKHIGIFGFGAACSQLTTDIGKYTIGRLRPHFISVCNPIMSNGFNCSHIENQMRYIEEFTCDNPLATERMLKEMRLSFPSGHSSFSAYTMIFCVLYLHARMNWKGSKLVKHSLQFGLIMVAWYIALSRISDYKHHWSDVLGGSLMGGIVALVIVNFVSDLYKVKRSEIYLPTTNQEVPPPINNGTTH